MLDAKITGVNRLFVMGFDDNIENSVGNNPPADDPNTVIENIFYQEWILKTIIFCLIEEIFMIKIFLIIFKKYEELRKVMTGRGEYYTTGSLLDYDYWEKNYKLICCDLGKQEVLDNNPKANQQIEFFISWMIQEMLVVEIEHKYYIRIQ